MASLNATFDHRRSTWIKPSPTNSVSSQSPRKVDKELQKLQKLAVVSSVWTKAGAHEDDHSNNQGLQQPPLTPSLSSSNHHRRSRSPTVSVDSATHRSSTDTAITPSPPKEDLSLLLHHDPAVSIKVPDDYRETQEPSTAALPEPSDEHDKKNVRCWVEENLTPLYNNESPVSVNERANDEKSADVASCHRQLSLQVEQARKEIERYKKEMQRQDQIMQQTINTYLEQKELESVKVRHLSNIVLKQEQLLQRAMDQLFITDAEPSLAHPSSSDIAVGDARMQLHSLRSEINDLASTKQHLEQTMVSLRGELDMSQSHMRLLMMVSTEIQNEYDTQKLQLEEKIKELKEQEDVLRNKQAEFDEQKLRMDRLAPALLSQIEEKDLLLQREQEKNRFCMETIQALRRELDHHHHPYERTVLTLKAEPSYHDEEIGPSSIVPSYLTTEGMVSSAEETNHHGRDSESRSLRHRTSTSTFGSGVTTPDSGTLYTSTPHSSIGHADDIKDIDTYPVERLSYTSSRISGPVSDRSSIPSHSRRTTNKSITAFSPRQSQIPKWSTAPLPPPTPPPNEPLPPTPPASTTSTESAISSHRAIIGCDRAFSLPKVGRSPMPSLSTPTTTKHASVDSRDRINHIGQRPKSHYTNESQSRLTKRERSSVGKDTEHLQAPPVPGHGRRRGSHKQEGTKWMDDPAGTGESARQDKHASSFSWKGMKKKWSVR
ncbi:uncharacterized protein BYT42DRAFT_91603 [Radiomyces spectabilis]|uniref:uncharacterized protein n=1 Tax=Radiomyces spectabilis TaxID=64574 RepID=UPI00221FAC11|nr:uncharacterized protein BYT42DRAFT_91603 [Radiomyces spectabilis]KAI8370514.1 hypothetical protein BYT42DRAFT_91603 [Radiomyces spectabilis]